MAGLEGRLYGGCGKKAAQFGGRDVVIKQPACTTSIKACVFSLFLTSSFIIPSLLLSGCGVIPDASLLPAPQSFPDDFEVRKFFSLVFLLSSVICSQISWTASVAHQSSASLIIAYQFW